MSNGIHCDGPACDTWVKPDLAMRAGFHTIFDGAYPGYAEFVAHFCSWDCILKYAAFKEPLEKVE